MSGEFAIREKSTKASFATTVFSTVEWHYNYALERKKKLLVEIDENCGETNDDQEKLLFDLKDEFSEDFFETKKVVYVPVNG